MKIQSIEKFLTERQRTTEEIELAKRTEEFYTNLYFLCLKEINEKWYMTVVSYKDKYTYLENLFSDKLPNNILFDTWAKACWALKEIYGEDKIKEILSTLDQTIITNDFTKEEMKEIIIPSVYKKDASGNIFFDQQIEKEKYQKPISIQGNYIPSQKDEFGQVLSNQFELLIKDEFGTKYNNTPQEDINYEKLDEEMIALKKALQDNIFISLNTAIKVIDVFYEVNKNIITKYVKYINNGKEEKISYENFVNTFGIGETKRKLNI